jgi:hypothetical protein
MCKEITFPCFVLQTNLAPPMQLRAILLSAQRGGAAHRLPPLEPQAPAAS